MLPSAPLRDKSNYFKENPSADVTPEAIVLALGATISQDAPADSYVKWQLLSAIPEKFDAKLAPAASAAYMKAAKPIPHPGLGDAARRECDEAVFLCSHVWSSSAACARSIPAVPYGLGNAKLNGSRSAACSCSDVM